MLMVQGDFSMIKTLTDYRAQAVPDKLHYNNKSLEFDYISKSDMDVLLEAGSAELIGRINLSQMSDDSDGAAVVIECGGKTYRYVFFEDSDMEPSDDAIGYVHVGCDEYVEVINGLHRPFVRAALFCAVLGMLFLLPVLIMLFFDRAQCGDAAVSAETGPETADAGDWDGMMHNHNQSAVMTETITIPGYAELGVSADMPAVRLVNPDNNTVNMVYTIYYGDEVIYKTDGAIPAGKFLEADLYTLFGGIPGTYEVTFAISTYDADTNLPCNGASQIVKIVII